MAKGRVRINEIENKEKRDLRKPKVGSFERTIYTHCLHNHCYPHCSTEVPWAKKVLIISHIPNLKELC